MGKNKHIFRSSHAHSPKTNSVIFSQIRQIGVCRTALATSRESHLPGAIPG